MNPQQPQETIPGRLDVQCDGCGLFPFVGAIYASTRNSNFFLCTQCAQTGKWSQSQGPFNIITADIPAPIRPNSVCDGCSRSIDGVGFTSAKVFNFDLCLGCHATGKWIDSHGPFVKQPFLSPSIRYDAQCDGCQLFPFLGTLYFSSRKAGTGATTHGPFLPMVFEFHQQQQQQQLQTYSKGTCQGCHAQMYVMAWRNVAGFRICGDCMLSGKYDLLQGPFYELASWHAMTMI
ncbi:unnamed protein product [Aphanomyces euteiches]